jgi:hypothetical protein
MIQTGNNYESALEAEAAIHLVDPINRELATLVDGVLVTIYVPPACDVMLRGERIKLRMVQPRDRVRVTYTQCGDSMIASAIEVQPRHSTFSRLQ